MTMLAACALLCLLAVCQGINPPAYTKSYRINAVIRLPYAEIVEPIFALFDPVKNRSRVDYYGGIQSTIQLAAVPGFHYGTEYKIVPFSTQTVLNRRSCFQVNGTLNDPAETTNILPDLTGFKYIGEQALEGERVNAFQKVTINGKKVSTYTFWSSVPDNNPVRYEVFGGDKYYVDYLTYESPADFQKDDFAVPKNLTCDSFPDAKSHTDKIQMNPIKEYVHHYDHHVYESFEQFKTTYKKQYSPDEHDSRIDVFRQTLRYINSKNRAGLSYTLAVNHFADKTEKEMKKMRGHRYAPGHHGGQKFSRETMKVQHAADQWDWRLIGAVTPVKDQAVCGSCWSFGTTGTIEGANFLKTGNLISLSEQELIDCSWGQGNLGCDGGNDFLAYQFVIDNRGLTSEEQYGQYLAIDGLCKRKLVRPVVQITNYTSIPEGDIPALQLSIFNKGPISVAIDASHMSFTYYSNGVYYEPACESKSNDLDHSVLAVGYGTLYGQKYWLIKNSWSTYWGDDGYILMSQLSNNCGVATSATYVDIK